MPDRLRPPAPDGDPGRFGPEGSRFAAVSRRAFLRATIGVGSAAAVGSLAACSRSDESVFGGASGSPSTASTRAATSGSVGAGTAGSTSTTSRPTSPTTAGGGSAGSGAVAAGSELVISFTYAAASSGRRVNNPYVAVWIEDADGELVDALGLWYLQGTKGKKWLNELRRWSSVDGSDETIDTRSSATRAPGDYALTWDLTDLTGRLVSAGDYYICIEAAREHGPYSLVRQSVPLGATPFDRTLEGDSEIASVEAVFRAG